MTRTIEGTGAAIAPGMGRFALVAVLRILFAALLLGIAVAPASAQLLGSDAVEQPTDAAAQADPFDRETPRGAVTGLLNAMAANDFERAAHYFVFVDDVVAEQPEPVEPDLNTEAGSTSEEAGREAQPAVLSEREDADAAARAEQLAQAGTLARKLKAALDRGGTLVPYAGLSNLPTGRVSDGLEPLFEQVGMLDSDGRNIPIILQRVELPDGRQLWRISPQTARAIAAFVPQPAAARTPEASGLQVAGAPAIDWLELLGIALVSFAFFRVVSGIVLALVRRTLADPESNAVYRFLYAGLPPLALYLAVLTFYLTADALAVSIVARQTLLRYAGIVAWIALAWFALRLVDGVARFFAAHMRRAERRQAVSIITFLRRGAKLLVFAVAAIAVLDTIGLDVTTGIAALGIGGLALALGAQKTIENLVGSITVIADKPLQVGDFAKVGDVIGTVEDIGMRSTRLRTNERTVVTIPNGDLASQRIENYAVRDRFLFHQTVGISYDTDAAGMEGVLEAIRAIIAASEDILDDNARVRFQKFGDSSLDIEIFCYFLTSSFPDSLAMQEEFLLDIMRTLAKLDVDIAFPTRTINLLRAPGDTR